MSAIAGIVCLNPHESLTEGKLRPMLETMRPSIYSRIETYATADNTAIIGKVVYGPDVSGEYKHNKVIEKPDVFCVGELYNNEALKAESVEKFLLERYQRFGVDDFARGLNGSFAAVLADPKDRSITLVTDHTASCPIFTIIDNEKLYFASEVKGLMTVGTLPCKPDAFSVLTLVSYGFFLKRHTIAENVRQMDYATICHIRDGKVTMKPYWRYLIEPERDKGRRTYITEFADLLRQAVQRRVRTGRCGLLLSGGVDSRGILACIEEPRKIWPVTYTLRTKETRHKLGDWAIAERVAEQLDMDLSVFAVEGRDFVQAMKDSVYASDGAAGFIFENIWEDVRQNTGLEYLLIGDECVGWTTGLTSHSHVLTKVGIHPINLLINLQTILRKDRRESFLQNFEDKIDSIVEERKGLTPYDRVDELYFNQRLIHYLNPKRRVIARDGLQVRNPWLDFEVLNFVRKLPYRYRIAKKLFRKTLVYLNPKLFRLPRAREGETIDYHSYLREYEREGKLVSQMIFSDNPFFREFFDVQAVEKLVKDICLSDYARERPRRFDPRTLLPMAIRGKVSATVRYFKRPSVQLSGVQFLLRILTVAVTLRHLARRCSKSG